MKVYEIDINKQDPTKSQTIWIASSREIKIASTGSDVKSIREIDVAINAPGVDLIIK